MSWWSRLSVDLYVAGLVVTSLCVDLDVADLVVTSRYVV